MAWNDDTLDMKKEPVRRAIDLGQIGQTLDDGAADYANTAQGAGQRLTTSTTSTAPRNTDFSPSEFAINAKTGEIALPNGEVVKGTPPILMQLATLKSRDGAPVPTMNQQTMNDLQKKGFRPYSQRQMADTIAAIPTESDFLGEAVSNGKTTLGLMASTIDSLFGNDDPNNAWSNAQSEHANDQTIGQYKASQGRWYTGWDEFINGLGQVGGNIGGTLAGAVPVIAAGAAAGAAGGGGVGALPAGTVSAGLALSGGAAAYGEQATDFYTTSLKAMESMTGEQLEQDSKLYREIVRANPGISEEEAKREVAIQGARMAGSVAGSLGAAEAMVGSKLAGNFLGRMGISKTLLGPAMEAVNKSTGIGATAGRVAGRGALGALGAGTEEMAESVLGQSAGASYTGVGSDNPMDYANIEEGIAAAQAGLIFGALGGRARSAGNELDLSLDPTAVANASDIGLALRSSPDTNQTWSRAPEITEQTDMIPAMQRRELGQREMSPGPTAPAPTERDMVQGQIESVLTDRFGPSWPENIDAIASRPEGRQLVAQLMAIEQDRRSELEDPAYQRGYAQEPVQNGQPRLQGPSFGDPTLQLDGNPPAQQAPVPGQGAPVQEMDPAQQQIPGMEFGPQDRVASEPQGAPPPLNLAERRSAQAMRQDEMRRLSEQNPQALPQAESRTVEQQIFDLEDQRQQIEEQIASRPPRDPRKKFLRQALTDVSTQLDQLEQQWQQAREAEGPQGVALPNRVDAPEPIDAPADRMPDGRPMGVSPAPFENPEPMSPEEAQSRAATQAERGAAPEQVQAAVQQSEEGVAPSTPEPAQDIRAQIDALADPASGRDAVFIADGDAGAAGLGDSRGLPAGAQEVYRKGVGTLLTTNPAKAREFRSKKLTDAKMAQILGYSEDKATALATGQEPTVVQAQTPDGAVAAEQIVSRRGVPAAKKAVAKQASKGAKVVATSVAAAQARRAEQAAQTPTKAAAAVTTSKERSTPKKKPLKAKKADDDKTRDERALKEPGTTREAQAPAPAASDTIERAAQRTADSVTFRGKKVELPERMTRQTGNKGSTVDMRVDALDSTAASRIGTALRTGTLSAPDRAKAEAYLRDHRQLKSMLDAAVTAAEDRLRPVVEKAGAEFSREAERRQIDLEEAATGKRNEKARTSPLAYLPLTTEESRGYLQAVRREAKAELASGYQPARSVVRQMISAINEKWQGPLQDERQGKQMLETFANLSGADLESVLQSTHMRIQDSTVAKQVMRGATEVAHAIRRMEQDTGASTNSFNLPNEADHRIDGVDAKTLPHTTEHGALPDGVRGVVNEWVAQFEKAGNKFSAPMHVMSLQDAMKVAPAAFAGRGRPNGKFLRMTDDKGKVTSYVLAVDWDRFQSKAAALEVLAHEFGHAVTTELYARSGPGTRLQIDKAFLSWIKKQEGRSVDDILRDQMPGVERAAFTGGATNMAYAISFWEWSARNAALYVLDPNRPHLSAVEKFFKSIADVMRKIYQTLTGSKIEPNWEEALDRWVDGSLSLGDMPKVDPANYNHEEFADKSEPQGDGVIKSLARAGTNALAPLREVMGGRATMEDVRKAAEPLAEGKMADMTKQMGLSLMTMRQIERQYRDTPLGKPLSGWVRNQQLKAKTANATMEAGSKWMEQANQLSPKVRGALEKIMYQSTHFGMHPDVSLSDKLNAHLKTGSSYVDSVNERRWAGLHSLYEAAVKADPRVPEIYRGLRDAFTDIHKATLAKQLEVVENADFSQKAKEQITQRIKAAQAELRQGPYFPLMRFGDWIVKVQLPAHVVGKGGKTGGEYFDSKTAARDEMRHQRTLNPGAQVSAEQVAGEPGKYAVRVYQRGVYFFESEAKAKAAQADIEKEVRENYDAQGVDYNDAVTAMEPVDDGDGLGADKAVISQPFKAREGYERTKGGSPEFMQEVRSLVNEKKLDPEIAGTLERLAIESLPENNYRQSLLPRQNVFGASQQMLRAYAHRFQGAAHHFASVEHGKEINRNWQRAWEVNRTYSPAGRVLNNLQSNQQALADRMSYTMGNRVMNMVTDASSLYSLGFSPAYALTNALQPWVVTTPVLAGLSTPGGKTIGMVKATKYLKDAYAGAMPFFTKRGISDFINEAKALAGQRGTSAGLQETAKEILTKFGKTPEEQRMLESLLERGTLDFSWLNSLEDAMRSGVAGQKWANLQRLGMAFPQQVEAMNRVTSALAAYRIAKDERLTDGSEASLQEFADDIVADTQLDYSRMNRPLAFNKAGLNVVLQFKLYMQGMYMLFARNAALAMRGATKEERAQGRKTIAYLLTTHAAAAGAAGLGPAAGMAKMALLAFAAMSGDDDDDWKSGDQLLREMLQDLLGEYGGVVAEKGLPALLGIDMSDRLGLPVVYDSRFAGTKETDSEATTLDKVLLYSLGAPYSNFRRVVAGTAAAAQGDFAKAANGLPSAARAMARSVKWANEGIVDQNGDTFVPREELGWGTMAINTMGLSPLATSTKYQQRTEVKDTAAKIMVQRKELLQASRTGDENAAERIAAFNKRVPKVFQITGKQESASAKSKAARERGDASKQEAAVKEMLGQ